MTDKGKFDHDLVVDGAGVQDKTSPIIPPGSTGDLTVTLQKGPMSSIARSTKIWEWMSPSR